MLQKIGTSRGIILTRDMIDHLGISDAVEIEFEQGRLVLHAPATDATPATRRRPTAEESIRRGIEKYRPAFEALGRDTEVVEPSVR